jgi:hypothetical protein
MSKFLKYLSNPKTHVHLATLFFIFVVPFGCAGVAQNSRLITYQSEAKSTLVSLYNWQIDYFSKNQRYSPCMDSKEADSWEAILSKYFFGYSSKGAVAQCANSTFSLAPKNSRYKLENVDLSKTVITDKSFTIAAIGKLCADCPADLWTINEKKELTHVQIGFDTNFVSKNFGFISLFLFPYFLLAYFFLRRRNKKN